MESSQLEVHFPLLLRDLYSTVSSTPAAGLAVYTISAFFAAIFINVFWQLLPRKKSEPPMVFHWFPFIGSAISYGMDPYKFYTQCREKYGEVFTFILFGKKMTVYLGVAGNNFILNGKLQDVNAEEIYGPLTTPVFGEGVVYDCPNSKLIEQKKFIKFGLSQKALENHVHLIEHEVQSYIASCSNLKGARGKVNIPAIMAEVTIFTAARALQGADVRNKFNTHIAQLYEDLEGGFQPINFLAPWLPLPQNRKRDAAFVKMRNIYTDIINQRRASDAKSHDEDMMWNLMNSVYKNGTPIPDKEIAHMMITLLMAGQHSSSSSSSWIMLRLASRPDIAEELYRELQENVGDRPFEHSDIEKLPLLQNVVKETLRIHSSIHSIMRKVKNPMPVPGTEYVITADKVLVASPIMTHLDADYFPDPLTWNPHRWESREEEEADEDTIDYGFGAISKGTKSPYLPFGAGRHRCIGEKFAYVNLCTIISTLIRNFKFKTLDGKTTVPPTDYSSLFSRPSEPAYVLWERR